MCTGLIARPTLSARACSAPQNFADSMRSLMLLSNVPRLLMDTLAVSAMVAIALVIIGQGHDMQSLLPALGMFAVAAIRLMPSASRIASGLAGLRFHYAATEVLYQALRETQDDTIGQAQPAPARGASPTFPFERSLVLEHLSYRYPSMPQLTIEATSGTRSRCTSG